MPTVYTAGIVDGTIKTFPEFAKLCIKNFGVAIHMRDEPMSKPYEYREISPYHADKLKESIIEMDYIKGLTDEEIINKRRGEIEDEIRICDNCIIEAKEKAIQLESILAEVNKWQPPTKEHDGIKEFMIQQITSTIEHDASTEYWDKKKREIVHESYFLRPDEIRKTYTDKIQWSIDYHTKGNKEEIERVFTSNKFAKDFFDSLPE